MSLDVSCRGSICRRKFGVLGRQKVAALVPPACASRLGISQESPTIRMPSGMDCSEHPVTHHGQGSGTRCGGACSREGTSNRQPHHGTTRPRPSSANSIQSSISHQLSGNIRQTPITSGTMMSDTPSRTPPPNLAALAEDHYFAANPPPKDLEKHVALAREFIDYHSAAGRRLVLVTSGGTTVPLGMSVHQFVDAPSLTT